MRALLFVAALFVTGCLPTESVDAPGSPDGAPVVDGVVDKEFLLPASMDGQRSVGFTSSGPLVAGLSSSTEVWPVSRDWDDVTPEAGVAWGPDSGLTWEDKYVAWVDSLQPVAAEDGHTTVMVTTPWGRALPAPRLECAEMAMFLRVTFAAWHELPFFMTAYSPSLGQRVYYGHFGQVTSSGARVSGSPRYASAYSDYTGAYGHLSGAALDAVWPDDEVLESRAITTDHDDRVEFLGPDAYAGAYFDEIHLNKRVGHFLLRLLPSFGSIHFTDGSNLYNLEPLAIREGDVLLHRWQAQGIGHVMVVKTVDELPGGKLDAEIIFGSMPRIQPKWYSPEISKSYFTSRYAGSAHTTGDGTPYSHLGGGLERWRAPKVINGRWMNTVLMDDRGEWIGSTDYEALEERPITFEAILGDLTPIEQRDVLLERIETARTNLSRRPASCANRQRREEAFDELYTLMQDEFGWTRAQVDATYRTLEDYTYAELDYAASKTCCWNSTTPAMHEIIVQYNTELVEAARDNGQCAEPVVFKARDGGGYDPFATYAAQIGRVDDWVAWSEDEACPQRGVSEDVETNAPWSEWCDVQDAILDGTGVPVDDGDTTGGGTADGTPEPTTGGTTGGSGPDCGGCSGQRSHVPWLLFAVGGVVVGRRRRDA